MMLSFEEHMQMKQHESEIKKIARIMQENNIDPLHFFETFFTEADWGKWMGAIPGALAGLATGGPIGALAGGYMGYKGGQAYDKMQQQAGAQQGLKNIPAIKAAIAQMAKTSGAQKGTPMAQAIQQIMQGLNTMQQSQNQNIAATARRQDGGGMGNDLGNNGGGDIPSSRPPIIPQSPESGVYNLKPELGSTPGYTPVSPSGTGIYDFAPAKWKSAPSTGTAPAPRQPTRALPF